jgi:addiction module HigA family antidote
MTTATPVPITPGEILLEEYMNPDGISQNALARALGVSVHTINEIVQARRRITPEMSLRLGTYFGQSDEYWFNLQKTCDFHELRKRRKEIVASVKHYRAVATQSAASKAVVEKVARRIRHLAKTSPKKATTRSGSSRAALHVLGRARQKAAISSA